MSASHFLLDSTLPSTKATRGMLVLACGAAATAHIPVIPTHLSEAPYMAVLFILLSTAYLVVAELVINWSRRVVYLGAAALSALAIAGYVLTRLVALPGLADDVGAWADPWGVAALASEFTAIVLAIIIARSCEPARDLLAHEDPQTRSPGSFTSPQQSGFVLARPRPDMDENELNLLGIDQKNGSPNHRKPGARSSASSKR